MTAAHRLPAVARLLALALAALSLDPIGADGTLWLSGGHVDLAPSGMPDISLCRREWSKPGSPPQWTHAGPVALADALWWLDSAAEPAPAPPPTVRDGHPLVIGYPRFGPAVDDHSAENLGPLVEDLAARANTDGLRRAESVRGTRWEDLVAAVDELVRARGLAADYTLRSASSPDGAWLARQVASSAGVVVGLGVWEAQAEGWRRVGGHYAAVAGAAPDGAWVALSDPLADLAALGGEGRSVPPGPAGHSCREAPRAHDDPAVVSHDGHRLIAEPALPHGAAVLAGYFGEANQGEAAAFEGQNPVDALAEHRGAWKRGAVVMALDAALALVPVGAATPTASPTRPPPTAPFTDTPEPTATTPATQTPTATSEAPTPVASRTPPHTIALPVALARAR
jgi:hypothetical protein